MSDNTIVVDGKLYDLDKAVRIHSRGDAQYTYADHGKFEIFKTDKGNYLLRHFWWTDNTTLLKEFIAGKSRIINFLERHSCGHLVVKIFGTEEFEEA